jgi:DNA-binding ferritin-like protein
MLDELRTPRLGLTDREQQDRLAQRVRLLGLKAKIEYQERLVEDSIVRSHPRWAEIRSALREALAPHPAALEAVRTRLGALKAWEDASAQLEAQEGDEEGAP